MSAADIFGGAAGVYTYYRAECQVTHQLCGGIPKDPTMIRAWLSARLDMKDRALDELCQQTEAEMLEASGVRPSSEELLDELVANSKGNGFKSVDGELVFEGRCVKGGLKEFWNIAFPGVAWPGKPAGIRKGLKSFSEERIFVEELFIPLGVTKPDIEGEQRVKHVQTPQGKRSTIGIVDLVLKPRLCFTVSVLDDFLGQDEWGRIWAVGEHIGFGADRARSDGVFSLERWERVEDVKPVKPVRRRKAS